MGKHIILDRSGDTRHEFDVADDGAVRLASERFRELTGKGFLAYAPGGEGGGSATKVRSFDPEQTVIFSPQLIGG